MILGFDGLAITASPAGVGTFARNLLSNLLRLPGGPEVVAVLPQDSAADADVEGAGGRVRVIRAPVRGPDTPRALWYQHARMPRLLRGAGATVHLAPSFVLPAFRFEIPSAVIVHDFAWARFPETKSLRFRLYMDRVVPDSVRRARAVFAPSAFARGEVLACVPGTDPGKVRVLAPGPGMPLERGDAAPVLAAMGAKPPFLLCVSNFDGRKNLGALLRAWRLLRERDGLPHSLVLAGGGERAAAFRAAEAGPGEPVATPGFLPAADLGALYGAADLVVVPSLYEGFGFPVLEAFAAGAPVACSRAASLAEAAGDAAVLFDPGDVEDMARGIREALVPGPAREARVRRGRERAAARTWEACAAAALEVLRGIEGEGPRG